MDLKEYIKSKRSTLSASSIITYASVLRSLYHKCFNSKDIDVKKFEESKTILEHLKDVPVNKRKTMLSALVIITSDAKYRDQMLDDVRAYNKGIATQEKTPEQEASWIKSDEVKKVFDTLQKQANLLYKKETLSSSDLQEIQNFVIVSLLSGVFIPPRRSLDYCNFKIREIDPAMNFLDKKVNKSDWLFFDTNGGKLSPVKLNQRLNKIFGGRKIGVNSLRHSYLTGKYEDTIKTNEALAADMKEMGSSMKQSTTYIKKE